MGSKAVERRYFINKPIEESYPLVQKALNELGLKKLIMKKEVPFRYFLAEYSPGWLEKKEIVFTFKEKQSGSEVSIKWFYPYTSELEAQGLSVDKNSLAAVRASEEERKQKIELLIEELTSRIGATDVAMAKEEEQMNVAKEREIIKEVIIKTRCSYCHNTYDETLDTCPHCGGKR